ncbi:MAG: GlsB/YeaQ/YmgE family stress response membrane protein [Pseudomonadota bacterium]
MEGVNWIVAIVIGVAAGWIAERLMNRDHGLVTNLVVGLVGALIGSFLAGLAGVTYSGWLGSLVASVIGAVVLLYLLGLFKRA